MRREYHEDLNIDKDNEKGCGGGNDEIFYRFLSIDFFHDVCDKEGEGSHEYSNRGIDKVKANYL